MRGTVSRYSHAIVQVCHFFAFGEGLRRMGVSSPMRHHGHCSGTVRFLLLACMQADPRTWLGQLSPRSNAWQSRGNLTVDPIVAEYVRRMIRFLVKLVFVFRYPCTDRHQLCWLCVGQSLLGVQHRHGLEETKKLRPRVGHQTHRSMTKANPSNS
jgi:hypothetical protein